MTKVTIFNSNGITVDLRVGRVISIMNPIVFSKNRGM